MEERPSARGWVIRFGRRLERFFFGDDVFISYSRRDGIRYATGLARQLTQREFACRIDFLETVPGREIPQSVRRALQRSGLLAIVGSAGACASPQVEAEIRDFLPTRRNLVPIEFDRTIEDAVWFPLIDGLTIETEPDPRALETGTPSESVVKRIEDSCDFLRRGRRLRRTFRATLAGTIVLIAVASSSVVWSRWQAGAAETRATDADRKAAAAGERERDAIEAADRAGRLADARAASADLEDYRRQRGFTPAANLPLAIESARALLTLGELPEAGAVVARSLSLVPEFKSKIRIEGGFAPPVMSANGLWIAAVVAATQVIVWRSPDLYESARFSFSAPVSALGFSLDGTTFAVGAGRRVAIFDTASGKQIAALDAPVPISRLSLDAGRQHIAGSSGDQIVVWELPAGEPQVLPGNGVVSDLVFTDEGRQLAVLAAEQGQGDTLFLYDLAAGRWDSALDNDSAMSLTVDGRFVSVPCALDAVPEECSTRILTLPGLAEHSQLPTRDLAIVTFSPDGRYAATSENNETRIWNVRSGLLLGVIAYSGSVVFSGEGSRAAVVGEAGVTSVYIDGVTAAVLEGTGFSPRNPATGWTLAGLSSRGRYAVMANPASGEVEAWLMEGQDGAPGLFHSGEVLDAAILAGGSLLAVRTREESEFFIRSSYVTVWDIASGEPRFRAQGGPMPASSPDGSAAVVDGDVVRFLARGSSVEGAPGTRSRGLDALAYVPGAGFAGLRWGGAGARNVLEVWDLARNHLLAHASVPRRRSAAFTPDGRFVFWAEGNELTLLNLKSGVPGTFSTTGIPSAVVCPPDRGCVAALRTSTALHVRTIDGKELLLEIPTQVERAVFSNDGAYFVLHRGGAIEVWELSGKRLLARRASPSPVGYLGFSPDGRRVIIGMQRRLEMWAWSAGEALDLACRRFKANAASSLWRAVLPADRGAGLCN